MSPPTPVFTYGETPSLGKGDPPAAIIQEDGREYALSIASDTQVTEVTFAGGQTCELYVSPEYARKTWQWRPWPGWPPGCCWCCWPSLPCVQWSIPAISPAPSSASAALRGKWQRLDFGWICGETRRDEIGALGRSLDRMSQRLSAALTDLRAANDALLGEWSGERELERQRSAFSPLPPTS